MEPVIIPTAHGVRYGCPLCPFDTADEATMTEHIVWRHRKAVAPIEAPKATKRKPATEPIADDAPQAVAPVDEQEA